MRHIKWFAAVLVAVAIIPATASSQALCGDADGDNNRDISDLAIIMDYLTSSPGGYQPTLRPTADCDDRLGVTVGDIDVLTDYMFVSFTTARLDCSIGDIYTFPQSLTDTIYLPFMVAIPDGVNDVSLPVITALSADTRAYYITALGFETNGPGLFEGSTLQADQDCNSFGLGRFLWPGKDSLAIVVTDAHAGLYPSLPGRHSCYEIGFTRKAPGLAAINVSNVLRNDAMKLRTCVAKNGNLYEPVIMYYEVPVPNPKVTVSPSTLLMESDAGFWSEETYQVSFTSDMEPVSFDVAVSDSWIVIENLSPTGYTTPATITVRANASVLPAGVHDGQILFSNIVPADAEMVPSVLDVVLTVAEPVVYPPGDLNCDGQVSLGDVALLIDCLFINTRPVPECD